VKNEKKICYEKGSADCPFLMPFFVREVEMGFAFMLEVKFTDKKSS